VCLRDTSPPEDGDDNSVNISRRGGPEVLGKKGEWISLLQGKGQSRFFGGEGGEKKCRYSDGKDNQGENSVERRLTRKKGGLLEIQ